MIGTAIAWGSAAVYLVLMGRHYRRRYERMAAESRARVAETIRRSEARRAAMRAKYLATVVERDGDTVVTVGDLLAEADAAEAADRPASAQT